jgi:hypothetical protein
VIFSTHEISIDLPWNCERYFACLSEIPSIKLKSIQGIFSSDNFFAFKSFKAFAFKNIE